jgi:phosphatidylserine decarboxylase
VGGDRDLAIQFQDGEFATLYLSPRDYHRIHMPCDGRLTRMIYIPGDLFSVNRPPPAACPACSPATSGWCASSRTTTGPFVLVLVGATIVGSMATVWHGQVNPPRPGTIKEWDYAPGEVVLKGRRDGPLPARLHGGDALPQGPPRFTRLGARPGDPHGRGDGRRVGPTCLQVGLQPT